MLGLPLLSYSSANVFPGTSLMTIKSQRVSPADPRQWMIIKGKARAGSLFIVGCAVESLTSFSATVGIWNWGTPLTAFSTRLCAASRTIHTPSSIRPAEPATFSMVEYCPTPSFSINCDFKAGAARSAAPPIRSSCTSNPAPPTLRVVSPTCRWRGRSGHQTVGFRVPDFLRVADVKLDLPAHAVRGAANDGPIVLDVVASRRV